MTEDVPIEITTAVNGAWTMITVAGDLDMATAPELEAVCAPIDGRLAIDLSSVRFIDSSGLRALFAVNQAADPVALLSPSAVVRRLLSLTDMDQVFTIADDESDLPG